MPNLTPRQARSTYSIAKRYLSAKTLGDEQLTEKTLPLRVGVIFIFAPFHKRSFPNYNPYSS